MPLKKNVNPAEGIESYSDFLLEVFLNNTDSSVILTDKSFNIVFFNKLADQWAIQFTQKPITLGMPLVNLTAPERRAEPLALLHRALEGNYVEKEFSIDLSDTDFVCFHVSYHPAKNNDGEIVGVLITSKNITEQKINELKLASNEHRFRSLVQSGTDLIGIINEEGNYVYISPTVKQLGYEIEFLMGTNVFKYIHPDDIKEVYTAFETLKNSDHVTLTPFRFIDAKGEWRWIETIATNFLNDPTIKGIVVNSRDITEKKQRDEVLQKALSDLNKILNSSLDVIVVTDEDNRYVQVSAAAETVWGYKPEELLGRKCFELIHPDDLEYTKEISQKVMQGVKLTNFENRYIRKDGAIVPLIWSAKWDATEKVMYAIARDASEKIQAEIALKDSEKKYKELFFNNPLPMFAYDVTNYKIVMVNEAIIEHTGYNREELLQKTLLDMKTDDDTEKLKKFLETADTSDKIRRAGEWKFKKKNGETLEVEIISHSIVLDDKNCRLVVIHDLTEKNKAKAALQNSEAMFRTISENFPNGIVSILSKDLRVEYIAGKELDNTGLSASYFIGSDYVQLFPSEEHTIKENLVNILNGETVVSELKFMNRNYLVSAVPLQRTKGNEKILVVAQNITTQKNAQRENKLLIEELTRNVNDLKQFSYITSHNLRAPISNLIGIMSLINIDSIKDADTAFLVEKFKESTYILNETVTDLMNILLIKNNVNVKKEVISLKQVWNDVCTSVNSQIENAGAEIKTNLDDDKIVFNKSYAESILLNLLTNSLKYRNHDRQLIIELFTESNDDYLILHFRDNGIGINLEYHRDKIFGLYQRFHNYPDSKGLGLYIVHSQITALGGKIEVESELNKGTCFKIYFKR